MSSIFSFFFGKGRRCTRGAAAHSPFPGGSPFLGIRSPVHTSCVSNTPLPGGSPFLGSRFVVHTSCVSNTPLPGWGVSPPAGGGRTALPRGA